MEAQRLQPPEQNLALAATSWYAFAPSTPKWEAWRRTLLPNCRASPDPSPYFLINNGGAILSLVTLTLHSPLSNLGSFIQTQNQSKQRV